ncbi:MAG TPA: glycosyltransferase WbuB [Sorangium sp.]|nr:glycosyltransferase WbuB [Sorangium sp.]
MRIVAINQFYAPDSAATAQLLTQLCEDLVRAGDEVTVVCSRQHYRQTAQRPAHDCIGGVEVVRVASAGLGRAALLPRLLNDTHFLFAALAEVMVTRRPDVVLALSSPPMLAAAVAAATGLRGIPLVCWVHDVYPDIAQALGVLSPRLTMRLRMLMRRALARATRVVALSEGMATQLRGYQLAAAKLQVIPNWADGEAIVPQSQRDSALVKQLGLQHRFVVMYSGTLGRAHEADTFIEAARLLRRSCPKVLFLFSAEGARVARAKRRAAGLSNVRWVGAAPAGQLSRHLAAAHVHLASLQAVAEGWVVPSKLYGVMAAGRPLIYVGPTGCEVARVLRGEGVGWVVAPGEAEQLAARIAVLAADRALVTRCGEAARALFETRYHRHLATERWRRLLLQAAAG